MYVLLDLKRRKLGVRELVTLLEQTVVNTRLNIVSSRTRADAPASMSANAKSALWDCGSVKVVLSTVWRLISPWISHRFAYQPLRLCRYGDDANAPVAAGSLPETVAPRLVANLLALLIIHHTNIFPGLSGRPTSRCQRGAKRVTRYFCNQLSRTATRWAAILGLSFPTGLIACQRIRLRQNLLTDRMNVTIVKCFASCVILTSIC